MYSTYFLTGLGNPDKNYKYTRHNIGKEFVKYLSERWNIKIGKKRKNFLFGKGVRDEKEVYLFLPSTFMNESGKAVKEIVNSFKISLDALIIIHDDADIPFGRIKIVHFSSSGGHKGVSSIIEELGTEEFPRLKIGIGKNKEYRDLTEYVLGKFNDEEIKLMPDIFSVCEEAVDVWMKEGISKCMSLYNSRRVLLC